jgi:hypothetical protein
VTRSVYYEGWQMECCGTPFAVGDEVDWPVEAPDPAEPAPAELSYQGHSDPEPAHLRGVVRRIQVFSLEFSWSGREGTPVPGSGALREVDRSQAAYPFGDSGPQDVGMVVDVEPR